MNNNKSNNNATHINDEQHKSSKATKGAVDSSSKKRKIISRKNAKAETNSQMHKDTNRLLPFLLELSSKYIILFVLLLCTALVAFFVVFEPSKTVSVPSMVGKSFVDASILLQEHQLYTEITQQYTSDPSDIGKVIKQSPEAGAKIRTKRVVTLTLSKGTIVSEVPDLVGFALSRAEDVLNSQFAGFEHLLKINSITKMYSAASPEIIIGQSPDAGTKINNAGTKISLIVSRGNKENKEQMHDLLGLPFEEVFDYLQELGNEFEFYFASSLKATNIELQDYYLPAGIILEQAPEHSDTIVEDLIIRIGIREFNLDQESVFSKPEEETMSFRQNNVKILAVPVKNLQGLITINQVVDSQIVNTMQVNKYQDTITIPYEEVAGVQYEALTEDGRVFWSYKITNKNNKN